VVSLDCSDDDRTTEALARLRKELEFADPVDEPPPCPCPGLARFTAANRDLLFRQRIGSALGTARIGRTVTMVIS
jgi:hypothetical protein